MDQINENISCEQAKKMVDENQNNGDFAVLDVRTAEEYGEGHLKNSVNIDIYSPDFENRIKELNKEKTFLVYCRSGNRSRAAAGMIMKPMGFKKVYNMEEGIDRWESIGYPVEK